MPWQPPERAPWVEKLVALGRSLGDDGRSMISLEADELLDAASVATGLSDFGDDWFREPLRLLTRSLDEEADLHLPGRLRTRGELQVLLENRLRLVETWRQDPSVLDEEITTPLFVTGLGRSGTTLLHELLACDQDNRAPLLWEFLHTPVGGGPPSLGAHDTRAVLADQEITVMDEMVPAFTAMHENRGHLPTECIFAFAHQASSDQFTGLYNVPSYTIWRSGVDQSPIYRWHRAMLQSLQRDAPHRRFVLKAPSHLSSLDLLFATYPDARVVITHRDPLRVLGSLADMMATLHWMHAHHADYDTLVAFLCTGLEVQMDAVTEQRDAGGLPAERISDVVYRDLVADPVGTVTSLYETWGLEVSGPFHQRLERYMEDRHARRGARHDYSFEDTGLRLAEHRALVAPYQERFEVPSEV